MDQRNHSNLNDQNRINSQSGVHQTARNSASGIRRGALEGLRRDLASSAKSNAVNRGRTMQEREIKSSSDLSHPSTASETHRMGLSVQNSVPRRPANIGEVHKEQGIHIHPELTADVSTDSAKAIPRQDEIVHPEPPHPSEAVSAPEARHEKNSSDKTVKNIVSPDLLSQRPRSAEGGMSKPLAASHRSGENTLLNADGHRIISEDETVSEEKSFTDSVKDLSADDISTDKKKKKKNFTGQIVRRVLMVIFSLIFIGSSSRLVYIIYDHYQAEQAYDDIEAELQKMSFRRLLPESSGITMLTLEAAQFTDIVDVNSSTSEYYEYLQEMKAKINYLQEKNPDIAGYINVPNTKIDYPILHCGNNEYYLNHDFLGNYRLAGAIFMDFRNTRDFSSNYNTCIYGHNLSNGNMMNNITLFRDETFFNENEYVEITSPDGLYIYQVFSIYKTDMYNNYIDTYFATPEAFVDFAYEMKSRSMYQREGVEFTSSDRLLTLSTCTNIIQEERYTLQAKLIRIER